MRCSTLFVAVLAVTGCSRTTATAPTVLPVAPEPVQSFGEQSMSDHVEEYADGQGCPFAAEDVPPKSSFDDSSLPEFRRNRTRRSNMDTGQQYLDDVVLSQAMMPLQREVFRCLDIAACYSSSVATSGELDVQFELGADGKIRAATVRASQSLRSEPIIPCTRMALARLDFPTYDGGNMFVEYSIEVDQ